MKLINQKSEEEGSKNYISIKSVCKVLRAAASISFLLQIAFIAVFISTSIESFAQNAQTGIPSGFNETAGFIENKGQLYDQFHHRNSKVKFLLKSKNLNVQLRKNGFSYDTYEVLSKSTGLKKDLSLKNGLKRDSSVFRFHRVDIEFPGANAAPQIISEEQSVAAFTYYNEDNPNGITVHQFQRVIYKELYPGIDLVFETRGVDGTKGFEYYFIVKPGAHPEKIKLQYNGANTQLKNECINIQVTGGTMEERIPTSFVSNKSTLDLSQLKNDKQIKLSYKNVEKGIYGFNIPSYDHSKTLIIDPTPDLVWGTYYGGTLNDWAYNIARDPAGNIIVCGSSNNPNLATTGAYQTTLTGFADAMLGKFKSNGNLLWMTYFGGEEEEIAYGVCSDSNGNLFIAGYSDSKTGISTPGCHQPVHGDPVRYGRDAMIAKFSPTGTRIWATYYGGTTWDFIEAIRCDAHDNIFVAGWTSSSNAISTPGSFQPTYGSGPATTDQGDGFVARFDNNGNRVWATYYGGYNPDACRDLAVDYSTGNIYVVCEVLSTTLASPGSFQPSSLGKGEAVLVKFDSNGNRLWATYYGSPNDEVTLAITCDTQGNPIIGGWTNSPTGIATTGVHQSTYGGGTRDVFVAKFDASGKRIWATYYGGSDEDFIYGLASDLNNNIIILGNTSSATNIATPNSFKPTIGLPVKVTPYIAKLDASGARVWGTYYGYGSLYDNGEARHAVTDPMGNIFVCGVTMAPSGISTCGAVQENWAPSNQDMFVAMFSETVVSLAVSASIIVDQTSGVCAGTPVTFTATAINGGPNPKYQWKVNGTNAGTNSSIFTSSSLNNGDQVTCEVTSNSPCIRNPVATSNAISVVIKPSVTPSVTISSDMSGGVCSGTLVNFTAQPVNGGGSPSYQWKINGNNVGSNSPTFSSSTLADGDALSCVITNLLSCNAITSAPSNAITVKITAGIVPSISISASATTVCSGEPVKFTASSMNAGNNPSYEWKVNGNVVGTGSTYNVASMSGNNVIICYLKPDNVACFGPGTLASNQININAFPSPDFVIQPNNPVISKGDSVQLQVTGTNISTYNWTPAQDINNTSDQNPKVWPATTTQYTLEATSANGCVATKNVTVTVVTSVSIPNAFTPNHDNKNDFWKIRGLELYPNCHVTVFNRWGQVVFHSYGYNVPWDGNNKGMPLDSGTFVYIIDLRNGTKPLRGTVLLVK